MNFLQNLTIKRRLQFNALIVGLAMIVMLCIIIYEARIMLKLNETIQYAEELEVHELSMRKYEKDFLFYKDESSLELFAQEYKKPDELVGVFLMKKKEGGHNELIEGSSFSRLLDHFWLLRSSFVMRGHWLFMECLDSIWRKSRVFRCLGPRHYHRL